MILCKKHAYLILLSAASATALAQNDKVPAKNPAQAQSVFVMPANPREGRDPFFPESTRPYVTAMVTHVAPSTTLSIRGFSGTPDHRTVIINNHSFAAGDEGDVLTPGGRVHVRCIEIDASSVVIEADGQRRDLHFGDE